MSAKTDWPKEVISNEDFAMLRGVLLEWCSEFRTALSSDIARSAARDLVNWFEFGIKNEAELGRLIRPV